MERLIDYFSGLDVSLDTVNVCIVNDAGDVLLERKIEAEPAVIADLLTRFGHPFKRGRLEAGPTSSWLNKRALKHGRFTAEAIEMGRPHLVLMRAMHETAEMVD
jgi:hypothetical protein